MDRYYYGRPGGDAVHGAAVHHRPCRTAPGAARRPDRGGLCHRARACADRHPAPAARGIPDLRRHLLPVDVDDAADRRLCAARRGALRAELRAAAAVGLGGLRGRRAGLRAAGRRHRRQTPDLGDRVGGGARRARQPRAAAAGQSKTGGGVDARHHGAAARSRLSRHHRRVGADPGQPRRLLRLRVDRLAAVGPGRADHCRALVARRARRDRACSRCRRASRCSLRCWW